MRCERTSRRIAKMAGRLLGRGRSKAVRSIAGSALRARENKRARKRTARKRG
jgi:hypothetical protein